MGINYVKKIEGGGFESTPYEPRYGNGTLLVDKAGSPDIYKDGKWFNSINSLDKINGGVFDYNESELTSMGWIGAGGPIIGIENQRIFVEVTDLNACPYVAQIISVRKGYKYRIEFKSDNIVSGTTLKIWDKVGLEAVEYTENAYFIPNSNDYEVRFYNCGGAIGSKAYYWDITVFEVEAEPNIHYTTNITYLDNKYEVDASGSIVDVIEWKQPNIVTDKIAADTILIGATEFMNDGIDYIDEDAIGPNPTAKIYPDGTIIGSTDYGSYIKYPNGELEITNYNSTTYIDITTDTVAGNIYSISSATLYEIVFPITFMEIPVITPTSELRTDRAWSSIYAPSTTKCYFVPFGSSSTSVARAGIIAKGRWK